MEANIPKFQLHIPSEQRVFKQITKLFYEQVYGFVEAPTYIFPNTCKHHQYNNQYCIQFENS